MAETALYEFTSHIAGKNAKVRIFPDRLEWEQPRGVSGLKIGAAAMTGGLSLLATGVKNGRGGTEMIPVRSINSVSTKRDGMINTIVTVAAAGSSMDFRVGHKEAAQVRVILNDLILGRGAPQVVVQTPVPSAAPADSTLELQRYAELHASGVLTDEEFAAKKAQLLGL